MRKFVFRIKNFTSKLIGKYYLSKKIFNNSPTIISNNCIAGVIYHDLGLEFLSPTINLYIGKTDFIKFISDLDYYCNEAKLVEIDTDDSFPVGLLGENDKTIKINFMHYTSFNEAKTKWFERCKRINFDNIYVIMEWINNFNVDEINGIDLNQFKNFIILSRKNDLKYDFVSELNIYEDFYPGKTVAFKPFSYKRYLNEFDYISFLNKTGVKNK